MKLRIINVILVLFFLANILFHLNLDFINVVFLWVS